MHLRVIELSCRIHQQKNLYLASLFISISFLGLSNDAYTQVYKWVDENGRTHYGDKPQSDEAASIDVTETVRPDSNAAARAEKQRRLLGIYDDEREEKKQLQAKEDLAQKNRLEGCKKAKKDLEDVRNATFIYKKTQDPDNPTVYSFEERRKITEKAMKNVKKLCT